MQSGASSTTTRIAQWTPANDLNVAGGVAGVAGGRGGRVVAARAALLGDHLQQPVLQPGALLVLPLQLVLRLGVLLLDQLQQLLVLQKEGLKSLLLKISSLYPYVVPENLDPLPLLVHGNVDLALPLGQFTHLAGSRVQHLLMLVGLTIEVGHLASVLVHLKRILSVGSLENNVSLNTCLCFHVGDVSDARPVALDEIPRHVDQGYDVEIAVTILEIFAGGGKAEDVQLLKLYKNTRDINGLFILKLNVSVPETSWRLHLASCRCCRTWRRRRPCCAREHFDCSLGSPDHDS